MIEDPRGQWAHPGKNTRIPGNQITMKGVDYPVWAVPDVGEPVLMQPGQSYTFPGASYVDEYPMAEQGGELPKAQTGLSKFLKYLKPNLTVPNKIINKSNKFKSEINWSNWNKDIPKNKALMDEYKAIEKTFKGNGTWMKNADGSEFKGIPEQFVQQNSENFKKAYPEGYTTQWRGDKHYPEIRTGERKTVFTSPDRRVAKDYEDAARSGYDQKIWKHSDAADIDGTGRKGQYQLYGKGEKHPFNINAKNKTWDQLKHPDINQGYETNTWNVAAHLEKEGIPSAGIKDIRTGWGTTQYDIYNQMPGNYLKSMWGNNGMFDMTNPNIYKALIPLLGVAGLGLPENKFGGEYETKELTNAEIEEYVKGGYIVEEELPKAQKGVIHVTDPNDPGYIAYKDSADVFQKQQQFNSQFLSNFPSVPIPAGDKLFADFDLMKVFMELKAKAGDPVNNKKDRKAFAAGAKEVWESMLAAPKSVDLVTGPWMPGHNNDSYKKTLKRYEKNMQLFNVTTPTVLRSGNYIPNSTANWSNTDNSPHKQNVIKRGLGYGQNYSVNTIDPYTEYKWQGKNWLTGKTALNKLESHGLSHNEVKHPTIKPIGHMRWHAAIPGYVGKDYSHRAPLPSSRSSSSFNAVDPESTIAGYEDANFYNISLPYYKAPVQKYILDKPPVVNTTLTTIPKPIPRTEASFERERERDETEDLMEKLTELGIYTGPIRGRHADENEEWQEALAKYENKEVVSSTPKTLKKPKEIKEPKTPEGYTLKTGYRGRDGIYYGNKYLPTTSKGKTHPVPGAPTMQDYWIKYPNERPKDKDLVSKQIGGELPKAQMGINGTLEPITLDDNPTDNMDPSGSGMNMDIEGIRNNLSPYIKDYVDYYNLQDAYFWEQNQENNKPKETYWNPNSVSNGGQIPKAKRGIAGYDLLENKKEGGELSQDQDSTKGTFVNSKEHGVDTPVYVQVEEKKSPIHGTGVFSKDPISKGQSIGVSHIRKEFEKNGEMYQAPFPSKQIGGYNHSEEPNVTEVDNGDHISLIAIRDIQPGEELLSNYDDSEIQDMERSSDFIRKDVPKAKDGHIVKQRRGVRENPDGSVSSHLMKAEYVDGRGWVAFPSLFQDSKPYADDQENWNEVSEEDGWWPIYQEAVRRGEVYDFGEDKEAALAFGRGSWKDQLPEHLQDKQKGSFQLELTPEEIDKYVKGGYVVEELPKAQTGIAKMFKYLKSGLKYSKPTVNPTRSIDEVINTSKFKLNDSVLSKTSDVDFDTLAKLNIPKDAAFFSNYGDITKKGRSKSYEDVISEVKTIYDKNPVLNEAGFPVYFHGSTSGSLPSIINNEGLEAFDVLRKKGITPLGGEQSSLIYPNHINNENISAVYIDNLDGALGYTGVGGDRKPFSFSDKMKKWKGSMFGLKKGDSKKFAEEMEVNMPGIKSRYENYFNELPNTWDNFSTNEKALINENFPVLFGLNPKGDKGLLNRFIIPNTDITSEVGIGGKTTFDEIQGVFVPESFVDRTQALFGDKAKVLPIETLVKNKYTKGPVPYYGLENSADFKKLKKWQWKQGGELPKAQKGLISLANLAKPLITGAGSSNKIIQGLSRGIINKGIDVSAVLAPKTMKKYAIDAAQMSAGQGDFNIAEYLEDINNNRSGDYMGQDVDYKNIHGKGAHKNRDLIDLYFNSNESNFSESRWLSELENKNALKKYTDYHGPLKSYKLLSESQDGEYISGYDMLVNEMEIANPSVVSKPGDRIDYSVGDGIYTRRGHDTYRDFGSWASKIADNAKKQNNPDKIIKAYNQIFDRFGDVIPFEVNSGYNQVPNFKLNNNPIKHIDDIAGHMAFLRRNSPNSFDLTTRDVWGFHPVDYNKKWLEETRDKTDPWIQGLGSKLFNKFGKPFILTQTNPLHFDFKKGGQLPKAKYGKWMKYLNPPNSITTSKKFLFTPPEELLRTEAAWEMLSKNNAWKQSHSQGFRDSLDQVKSKYNYSKLIREKKSKDKELWKLLDKKKQGKTENIDDKIDEIQKIRGDIDQRMMDVISDYSNFKLDYSGLPVTRAFNKYGHALGGGQGRLYNNLLNDKEYIKYGSYFGDNNDLQNLINVGKTYNNPLVEAAFPTEAFPVGDSRFVQFMPKLDWKSTPLGMSDNDKFNIIKDLSDQGVGIDYSGADNIGGVGDKFGLVDLTYIGKPGQRNNAFNVHSDVFIPNRKNPLGSKELINEIREMLAPGTNVRGGTSGPEALNKYGGTVELGDVVDKATMERLKAQGYTFEEI